MGIMVMAHLLIIIVKRCRSKTAWNICILLMNADDLLLEFGGFLNCEIQLLKPSPEKKLASDQIC
jgi:hypothetical protein